MVTSTTTSITPAEHADRHRTGGEDPLTGSVGINMYMLCDDDNSLVEVAGYMNGSVEASWLLIPTMELSVAGVIPNPLRVSYRAKQSGSILCGVQLYKNGAPVGLLHMCVGDGDLEAYYTDFTEDIPDLSDGDTLQIYSIGSGGAHFASAGGMHVKGCMSLFNTYRS